MRSLLVLLFFVINYFHISKAVDCTLPSSNTVNEQLRNEIIDSVGEGGTISIRAGGPYYTCQVQGTTMGTYQELSVIMEYTSSGTDRVGQFEMTCQSSPVGWGRRSESLTVLLSGPPGVTYDGSISLWTNCSSCINTAGNDQHCVACDSSCNDGLMRCTGSNSDDCCLAFEDDGACSKDTECDDTNFVASQQNDFFCSCNLTSCDPGYSVTTNSSGCYCVLSNICMTQPSPCNNNGSCTLNSAPDNFTCDCTGTGYTGDTCNDLVVVSTTTSSTTTTMPPSSADTTTTSSSMTTSTPPVVTMSPATSTDSGTSISVSVPPTSTPTSDAGILDDPKKTALWVIIVSVIIGLILLILLIILIIYIIYYCITGRGSNLAKAKTDTPFGNGESHNNPLYLKPDEVTSEVANLYTP